MIKKLLTTALVLSVKLTILAQGAGLTFTQTSGTYIPITGGTVLVSSIFDDNNFAVTLPASFTFKGISYNQVTVNTNGWISLGSTAPSNTISNPISSTAIVPAFIAPFGTDLENADGGAPELRWQQSGNEIIFQWKDVKRISADINTEIFNFQLRLNTLTGAIQFVYGAFSNVTASTIAPRVGIRAETNAFPTNIYNRLVNTTITSNTWATSVAGTSNNSSCRFTSASPATSPATGQTFTWTPIDCSGFSCTTNLLPVGGSTINSESADLSWNAVAGAISYKLYFGTSLPLPLVGTYTGTTATINNLNINTEYLWYIAPAGFNCISSGCETATTSFNSGCVAINCVSNVAPANMASVITSAIPLSWNSASSATAYELYLGTTNPPTTLLGTFTGTSTTVVLPNNTYFWYVHPRLSCLAPAACAVNTTQFIVNNSTSVVNDICEGAIDLAAEIELGSTTFNGIFEFSNPSFCAFGGTKDIWFKFKATATTASVSVRGDNNCLTDPGISLFSGTCNSLTCLGSNDAGSCTTTNTVSPTGLTIGNTYYVRISTFSFAGGIFILSGTNIGSTPLPLKLISFSGSKHSNEAVLQWKTSNEINVSRFEVERSNNGTVFGAIGTVAAFNESGTHLYSYTDNINALRTAYFYRLKMVDKDGKSNYSNVIYLNENRLPSFTIFPNPVKELLTIGGLKPNGTIRLISMDGKIMQEQKVFAQNITLKLGGYAKGTYLLQYVADDKVVTQKIIKQ
jgi:hypothetical protein